MSQPQTRYSQTDKDAFKFAWKKLRPQLTDIQIAISYQRHVGSGSPSEKMVAGGISIGEIRELAGLR